MLLTYLTQRWQKGYTEIRVTSTSTEWVRELRLGSVGSVLVKTLAAPAVSVPSDSKEGHAPSKDRRRLA